ncbi:hypothetical protein HELRODRAFT_163302 [Helobdella robusta]|uniref:Uncharacterized protein n=1 Tax=Helobdella robusta TaxID=6412 RepID=T1ETV9_HELRO|nr:hypothetical protein HELRODRAFT_163302 [Helobdella robusta]ESN96257.1 hypothetical protein HELRODRAFT_163302 [Helobdella robusta]
MVHFCMIDAECFESKSGDCKRGEGSNPLTISRFLQPACEPAAELHLEQQNKFSLKVLKSVLFCLFFFVFYLLKNLLERQGIYPCESSSFANTFPIHSKSCVNVNSQLFSQSDENVSHKNMLTYATTWQHTQQHGQIHNNMVKYTTTW